MKFLSMARCSHLAIYLLVLLTITACGEKPLTAKQVLDQAYPVYDQKHACWISDDGDAGRYCMKLDSEKKLTLKDSERLYVMVSGSLVDENGDNNGGHSSIGAVGAFVSEARDGKNQVIAANPLIAAGAFGVGPVNWQLVKLGPNDYWGWQNTWGDCHQGYCGSRYTILAPYGKSVKEIGFITGEFDNTGACGGVTEKLDDEGNLVMDENGDPIEIEVDCNKTSTSIQSQLIIDTKSTKVKVYPLLITLTGRDKGIEVKSKAWVFNFDYKKWQYKDPANYPIADADF